MKIRLPNIARGLVVLESATVAFSLLSRVILFLKSGIASLFALSSPFIDGEMAVRSHADRVRFVDCSAGIGEEAVLRR